MPIGHIECKNIGTNLDRAETDEQLTHYRTALPNLILIDYLELHWYAYGEIRVIARLGRIDSQGRVATDRDGAASTDALFDGFLTADPRTVAGPRELADRMAAKARLLRDGIGHILQEEGRSGPLRDMLAAYRDVLIADLKVWPTPLFRSSPQLNRIGEVMFQEASQTPSSAGEVGVYRRMRGHTVSVFSKLLILHAEPPA